MNREVEVYCDQFNVIGAGGQHRILMIAKGLTDMGYEVILNTPFFRTTYKELVSHHEKYYIDREKLYHTWHGRLNYYLGNVTILPFLATKASPSIIVLPSPIFRINIAPIKKFLRSAVLADFGDIYFSSKDPQWYIRFSTKYLNIFMTNYVDYVILPTRKMLKLFQRTFPHISHKAIHIPSSIDTSHFMPSRKTSKPTIAYIGALVYGKGVELLPSIIYKIIRFYDDVSFVIIGSGPLEIHLRQVLKKYELEKYVYFVGNLNFFDIPKICGGCWIGLSLYPGETVYPVDILKALIYMSLEMPIITSTNIEEAKDVAIRTQFSSDKFVEAILRLIRNDELRKRISQKSRQIVVNNYDIRIVARRYHNLLIASDDVIGSSKI